MATQEAAQSVPRMYPDPMVLRGGRLDDIEVSRIYFIAGAGLVKIGVTTNVKNRVQGIVNSSPVELEYLGSCPGTRTMEREWHGRFRHLRRHGEWFSDTDELRAAISESAAHGFGAKQQESE